MFVMNLLFSNGWTEIRFNFMFFFLFQMFQKWENKIIENPKHSFYADSSNEEFKVGRKFAS